MKGIAHCRATYGLNIPETINGFGYPETTKQPLFPQP